MNNLFTLSEETRHGSGEHFAPLLSGAGGLLVERIVSHGHASPEGTWYDQEQDEWVVVLQGEAVIGYADGREAPLGTGDHLFLPRHVKHRVVSTTSPCIWLAVHGEFSPAPPAAK